MARINVDTTRLSECGRDFVNLTTEYNQVINECFDMLLGLTEKGAWDGVAATKFQRYVNGEKISYIALGETLMNYGRSIQNSANSLEASINGCRR